jgi:hypothetical protein
VGPRGVREVPEEDGRLGGGDGERPRHRGAAG